MDDEVLVRVTARRVIAGAVFSRSTGEMIRSAPILKNFKNNKLPEFLELLPKYGLEYEIVDELPKDQLPVQTK